MKTLISSIILASALLVNVEASRRAIGITDILENSTLLEYSCVLKISTDDGSYQSIGGAVGLAKNPIDAMLTLFRTYESKGIYAKNFKRNDDNTLKLLFEGSWRDVHRDSFCQIVD